jgi:hypothetical protein
MNARPIIDAGPALNFLSIRKERLLLATLGRLSTPEIVAPEVMRDLYERMRKLDDGLAVC